VPASQKAIVADAEEPAQANVASNRNQVSTKVDLKRTEANDSFDFETEQMQGTIRADAGNVCWI
jgi:hypothetical protein